MASIRTSFCVLLYACFHQILFAQNLFEAPKLRIDVSKINYESLPYGMYALDTGTELVVGKGFQKLCFTKLNRREYCYENGACPDIRIFWNLPVWLKQAQLSGYDTRTTIWDRPVRRFPAKPDDEVHSSMLSISDIGLLHIGQYSCVFKYINKQTGKIHPEISHEFSIDVRGGKTGSTCRFGDQCESDVCINNQCVCDKDDRVYVRRSNGERSCYPDSSLGQGCLVNKQCKTAVGKNVFCGCKNSSGACIQKTCQCVDGFTQAESAFRTKECLAPVKLGGKCKLTDQCAAADQKTFCSFDRTCRCRSGQSCYSVSGNRPCTKDSQCIPGEFCFSNTVCKDKKDFGDSCELDEQCLAVNSNTKCNKSTGKCSCKDGFKHSSEDTCIESEKCFNDLDCNSQGAYCDNGVCKEGISLLNECKSINQCFAKDKYSFCGSPEGLCRCLDGYYPMMVKGKEVCTVKGGCFQDEDCNERSFGFCSENLCSYRAYLGKTCQSTEECVNAHNYTICDSDTLKCRCLRGFVQEGKECVPVTCNTDTECQEYNKHYVCSSRRCACPDGFYLSSFSKCIRERNPWLSRPTFLGRVQLYIIVGASFAAFLLMGTIIAVFVVSMLQQKRTNPPLDRARQG